MIPCCAGPVFGSGGAGGGAGGGGGLNSDFSVNSAGVNGGYQDGSIVLRTGSRTNAAGGYTGGGTGNKSISGVFGRSGLPIGSLTAISYRFTNATGPGGPFFIPPGGPTTLTPYCNFIVDFGPPAGLKVCIVLDDSLAAAITAAIGTYVNNGFNVLTYTWTAAMSILIVGQVPPAPGGVAPSVTVGPGFLENAYSWPAIVAANPGAVLRDAFTGDGGLPSGAVTPAIMLVSGDSLNVVKSGKRIEAFSVNGVSVL